VYRQQRSNPFRIILRMILIGVLVGTGFYVFNNPVSTGFAPPLLPTSVQILPSPTPFLPPQPDEPQVRLLIPSAVIVADIVPVRLDSSGTWNVSLIGEHVGHLQGTAWIDQPGNIGLAGHSERANGNPGVFSHLADLHSGDEILMQIDALTRRYVVDSVYTTVPEDLTPLYPTTDDRLTLTTCTDYDFVTGVYRQRVIAVAVLSGVWQERST